MNKVSIPFDRNTEWQFVKKRNKFDTRNEDFYVKWILKTLKDVALGQLGTDQLPQNHRWDATCLHMSKENCDYLHTYLDSMVWLDYSPKQDTSLSNHEVVIDIDKITEDQTIFSQKKGRQ